MILVRYSLQLVCAKTDNNIAATSVTLLAAVKASLAEPVIFIHAVKRLRLPKSTVQLPLILQQVSGITQMAIQEYSLIISLFQRALAMVNFGPDARLLIVCLVHAVTIATLWTVCQFIFRMSCLIAKVLVWVLFLPWRVGAFLFR